MQTFLKGISFSFFCDEGGLFMTLNGLSGKGLMYCCLCFFMIAYYFLLRQQRLLALVAFVGETRGGVGGQVLGELMLEAI